MTLTGPVACGPSQAPDSSGDAAADTAAAPPASGELREALAARRLRLEEGLRQNDATAMAAVYSDEAMLLPPGDERVRGQEEIERYFTRPSRDYEIRHEVLELDARDDLAYEVGVWTAHVLEDGTVRERGEYLWLWRRQSDGSWKIHRDAWNLSPSAR